MNKAVLMSIQPKWCELIAYSKKTIEVRKTAPKLPTPFKCYIYATQGKDILRLMDRYVKQKGKDQIHTKVCRINNLDYCSNEIINGKVIGEFVCEKVEQFTVGSLGCDDIQTMACLSYKEMIDYFYKPEELDGKTVKFGFALHISQVKIYDKPKELGEFKTVKRCKDWQCFEACSDVCGLAENNQCHDGIITKRVTCPPQSFMYVKEN